MAATSFTPLFTVCNDLSEMTAAARRAILDIVNATPSSRQASLALSGGSTPRKLYESLHEKDLPLLRDAKRVLFFLGDDRLYALDNPLANYHMAKEALLRDVPADCVVPIDPTAAVSTSEDPVGGEPGARTVAAAYNSTLLRALPTETVDVGGHAVEVPVADIVLLGFGSDGHTASVFPHSVAAGDSSAAVSVSFPSPTMSPKVWRVTLTPLAICRARHVIVLAAGADKEWVVDGITQEDAPAAERCPVSRFLRQCRGQVHFILDKACAGKRT